MPSPGTSLIFWIKGHPLSGRGDIAACGEGVTLRVMSDGKLYFIAIGVLLALCCGVVLAGWLLGPVGWFVGGGLFCTAGVVVKALIDDRRYRRRQTL